MHLPITLKSLMYWTKHQAKVKSSFWHFRRFWRRTTQKNGLTKRSPLATTRPRSTICLVNRKSCSRTLVNTGVSSQRIRLKHGLAYRAVGLLSKVNNLYYERAKLFQTHYGDRLTQHEASEIEYGLSSNLLFGLRVTVSSINFVRYTKGNDGIEALDLGAYRIRVTAEDIAQLEQMECNYKSVAANSGNRGTPYAVGDYFNLTAHQFRHTFAWFIIANRLGDLDDIKYQFKHLRQAMTLVYAERGFKSLNELRGVIEYFETFVNGKSINDIVQSAVVGNVAGGGGERLVRLLQSLNDDVDEPVYGTDQQPHFKNAQEVVAFTTRHSESIRGLPHGYCTKGPSCKIKNAADPSHCLYCDTYFATPKHLPYWKAIKINCERKISRIEAMPDESREQFQVFRQSLDDNLFAANKIISRLEPTTGSDKQEAS